MTIKTELVFDGNILSVPESMGKPSEKQLASTALDNLIELSGRICYDSLGAEKSRDSQSYHEHIIEVNHGSVSEHANITVSFDLSNNEFMRWQIASTIANRPGVYGFYDLSNKSFRITANIRSIREWNRFSTNLSTPDISEAVGFEMQQHAKLLAPLAMQGIEPNSTPFVTQLVKPIYPEEIWLSFYIGGVSRGLSHELVRHKWRTAVSQRSTRYVDESQSDWAWHPLINKYSNDLRLNTIFTSKATQFTSLTPHLGIEAVAKEVYTEIVARLQELMLAEGVDNFTARKQARGAARGVLGNALSTELIFSASLAQWLRIIDMRSSEAADAEIREMSDQIRQIIKERFDV